MKVTIKSEEVRVRQGVSAKTGKPWKMITQMATAETEEFRQTIQLTLPDDGKPYPLGEYNLDVDKSLRVNGFGEVELARTLVLTPATARTSINQQRAAAA